MNDVIKEGFERLHFLEELYAAGGCVRDALLGREIKDVDFATRMRPHEMIDAAEAHDVKTIPTGIEHGTITFVSGSNHYEVTTFRKDLETDGRRARVRWADLIEEDLERRDFTINAMAMHRNGYLIDPCGGRRDLELGLIRFVGDAKARIEEDYLRVIRGCRFAGRYNFNLTGRTWHRMHMAANWVLKNVSIERVTQEFSKAFEDLLPSRFLRYMYRLTLLQSYIPQTTSWHLLDQHPKWHPEGTVLEHVLEVVDRAPPSHRWHALLHDIGKNATAERVIDEDFREYCSFHGHEDIGADMIPDICRRIRLPNALRDSIEATTRWHMYPLHVTRNGNVVTDRIRRRFQGRVGAYLSDVEIVCKADAGHSFTAAPRRALRRSEEAWKLFDPLPEPVEPVLMGRHLIGAGLAPGPEFGVRLNSAFEHQLDTGCRDVDELLEIALSHEPPT